MALRNLTSWDELWALLDDMHETLEKAGGYGCAAVHVSILRRVVVINDESGVIELINPVIIEESSETQEVPEGFHRPRRAPRATVIRPKSVTVSAHDRSGTPITVRGSDFLAATLCHEIDHLDGMPNC